MVSPPHPSNPLPEWRKEFGDKKPRFISDPFCVQWLEKARVPWSQVRPVTGPFKNLADGEWINVEIGMKVVGIVDRAGESG